MTDIPAAFVDWSPAGLLALVVLFVITDKLVWHKRLEKAEAQRDAALDKAEKATEHAEKSAAQVDTLIATVDRVAAKADLSVVMLTSVRRHLGIEEEPR